MMIIKGDIVAGFFRTVTFMMLFSCNIAGEVETSPVHIRVHNSSSLDFDSVKVWDTDYGSLEAGSFSGYRTYDKAYELATVSVSAGGNPYGMTVIDYVGEEPLVRGFYTLYLYLEDAGPDGFLIQEMKKD